MRLGLLQRCGSWPVVFSLLALCLVVSGVPVGFPVQAEPILLPAATVDIAVVPSSKTVQVNDTFTLNIYVYPNGQPVDAMDADLVFHPRYLEVQSITGDGSGLEFEFKNDWNNTTGTLTHSRGASFTQTPPSDTFRLCSILLKARTGTDGTTMAFTALTNAYFEGASVLRDTTDGTVVVTSPYPTGDLDQDCDVDIDDIMSVASRWRTSCENPNPDNKPDTPNYDPLYDFDSDCDIDVVDIMLVVVHWGETC